MGQRWLNGYSADVEIYLLIDREKYDGAQIGGRSLILREPKYIPPATCAKLVTKIDGHEEIEHVLLIHGSQPSEEAVAFF